MLVAVVSALVLQQAGPAPVIWQEPPPAAPVAAPAPVAIPPIPDWARSDPYGYERSECSPLVRRADESMEACQARVRAALAAHLGDNLPVGLAAASAADRCRQEAAGDRYALQCGAPERSGPATPRLTERTCETRPRPRPEGGVSWSEACRPADGSQPEDEGLRLRLGGTD